MKRIKLTLLTLAIVLLSNSCGDEPEKPESKIGHIKISVGYPVSVRDETGSLIGYVPGPAEGVTVRLYRNNARCLGYKDAGFGIAWTDEKPVQCLNSWGADEDGVIELYNIPAKDYYLTLFASKYKRYSEKQITVPLGDTLNLKKDFTNLSRYRFELEPWDEPYPPLLD